MSGLTATQLATKLDLSKGRISQLVTEGKLDGCYKGDGRSRRFDLAACANALNRKLDPGQMMGNGARTRQTLREIEETDSPVEAPQDVPERDSAPLRTTDQARYEMARTLKAEEEARKLRRLNAQDDGTLVLADQAGREARRALAAELAQFENVLRNAARAVADKMGVDFKTARQIMIDVWREHRGARAQQLDHEAEAAEMVPEEQDADF
jgi:transcriptional regulator with XRE-family HTH domain